MIGDKQPSRVAELIANAPDSHAEIALKLGVDKSTVTKWRTGTRRPSDEQLGQLEQLYGKPPPPSEPAPPSLPPDDVDDEEDAPEEGNNARLQRYIRNGIRELENDTQLSGVKRAEALKKLVDAQVALDKSTGENAITMNRIAQHPEFKRVVRLITEAIAPHPEALAKVLAILGPTS